MVATVKGIYHNLLESRYVATNGEIFIFFSSVLYRDKFIRDHISNREKMGKTNKLWQKQNIDIGLNFTALHDILCYRGIEKRGFRINFLGADMTWLETQNYVLRKMIEPNTSEFKITSMQKFVEHNKNLVSTYQNTKHRD